VGFLFPLSEELQSGGKQDKPTFLASVVRVSESQDPTLVLTRFREFMWPNERRQIVGGRWQILYALCSGKPADLEPYGKLSCIVRLATIAVGQTGRCTTSLGRLDIAQISMGMSDETTERACRCYVNLVGAPKWPFGSCMDVDGSSNRPGA
jgi:hypothetical protein